MNTNDLIEQLARRLKISQKSARRMFQIYIGILTDNLADGKRVVLRGFGTFEVREAKERQLRLPSSGEKVLIPSRRVAAFRPSQRLKDYTKLWQSPE